MPTYHLEIDLDNAAFWGDDDVFNGDELAAALSRCAESAAGAASVEPGEWAEIYDSNGNRVGREWITE